MSFQQSPATDQYFEARASKLFELQKGDPYIEIHVQRPNQDLGLDAWNLLPKSDSKQDVESVSEPESPIDWDRYLREDPPRYAGKPGLEPQRISDRANLERISSVRKLMAIRSVQADLIHTSKASKKCFRIWCVHYQS